MGSRSIALAVFVAGAVWLAGDPFVRPGLLQPPTASVEAESRELENFSLEDQEGVTRSLNDFVGKKPLFVYFYSGCCGHCTEELTKLSAMVAPLGDAGFELLGVEYLGEKSSCHQNMAKFKLTGSILSDKGGKVCGKLGVGDFTVFVLDTEGKVRYRGGLPPVESLRQL